MIVQRCVGLSTLHLFDSVYKPSTFAENSDLICFWEIATGFRSEELKFIIVG